LPPGAVLLLHGPPGSGKSSIALAALPEAWIATSEMAPELLAAYAARIKARPIAASQIRVTFYAEGGAPLVDLGVDAGSYPYPGPDLIVDSATGTAADLAVLDEALRYAEARGARVIVILHETKDGKAWGRATLVHAADVVARVDRGVVAVAKNRHGGLGSAPFKLGPGGVGPPSWRGYYSIEGRAPHYRAARWPATDGKPLRYADVYRANDAEQLACQLPRPPIAVCALRVFGRWEAPEDLAQREAWARSAGLRMWHPVPLKPEPEADDGDDAS
jgi:hypothetical protein